MKIYSNLITDFRVLVSKQQIGGGGLLSPLNNRQSANDEWTLENKNNVD